jgi:hypothetical protein
LAQQDPDRAARSQAGGGKRLVDAGEHGRQLAPAVPAALELDGLRGRVDGQHLANSLREIHPIRLLPSALAAGPRMEHVPQADPVSPILL